MVCRAVFCVRGSSGGNAGALCSTGAASSDSTVEKIHHVGLGLRFCGRSLGRSLGRSVLNDDARAVRRSKAMNGDTPPVFADVARQLRISAQIIFF